MKTGMFILVTLFLCNSCSTTLKTGRQVTATTSTSKLAELKVAIDPEHDGSSYEKAVVVKEKYEGAGVKAEYTWLRLYFPGCQLKQQSMTFHKGKSFDILDIVTLEGTEKSIYFDISNFYGKL